MKNTNDKFRLFLDYLALELNEKEPASIVMRQKMEFFGVGHRSSQYLVKNGFIENVSSKRHPRYIIRKKLSNVDIVEMIKFTNEKAEYRGSRRILESANTPEYSSAIEIDGVKYSINLTKL